jgi:type IV pilus assembly protein PilE
MQRGLSLIELLIVVALIGMLAAIAYPSYSDPLRRAALEVVGLLQDAALRLARHHTRVGGYADNDQLVTPLPAGNRYYQLQARRDADSFTLLATRLPSGMMAHDSCGDFQLDQAGVRSNPGLATALSCAGEAEDQKVPWHRGITSGVGSNDEQASSDCRRWRHRPADGVQPGGRGRPGGAV